MLKGPNGPEGGFSLYMVYYGCGHIDSLKTIATIVTEHPELSDIGRNLRAVCIASTSCLAKPNGGF